MSVCREGLANLGYVCILGGVGQPWICLCIGRGRPTWICLCTGRGRQTLDIDSVRTICRESHSQYLPPFNI